MSVPVSARCAIADARLEIERLVERDLVDPRAELRLATKALAAFGMLAIALCHRCGDAVSALRIVGGSLLASYVAAVVVNVVRIGVALQLAHHPAWLSSLSASDAHRLQGVAVYFGGLVLLHELVRRLDRRAFAPGGTS